MAEPQTNEPPTTVVDRAVEELAFRIASGALAPGDKLPSIRNLARDLSINPSTTHIVVTQLKTAGFIEGHQRLGYVVRDIHTVGGIETWPYLFRFSQRLPELASRMLEDFLGTRLLLAGVALRRIAANPRGFDRLAVQRAVDRLEMVHSSQPDDLVAFARAELQAMRAVMVVSDQRVALAVFNSITDILLGVPEVIAATYQDTPLHLTFWRALMGAWESGELSADGIATIEAMMSSRDTSTIKRFGALVTKGKGTKKKR
jgi:GntR family transcriptional regulator, transcriptional repressor for pyruvate dehydrogenase complex